MTVGPNSQSFYLINESPASSTSTLVLRTPGTAPEYHTAEEEYDSSIYFATTTPSSPYMRSPGQGSSPRALPSQDSLHDCPPESSSPLISSISSACSSPYFSGTSTSTSTSSEGNGDGESQRDLAGPLDDWYYPRILRQGEDVIELGDRRVMDEFAQGLYSRLLVVVREREREAQAEYSGSGSENADACTGSLDGLSYVSSRAASGTTVSKSSVDYEDLTMGARFASTNLDAQPCFQSRYNHTMNTIPDTDYSVCELDLDTPSFASPSASENITPPRDRKRFRETGDRILKSRSSTACEVSSIPHQPQYRLIWRAESFQVIQGQRQAQEEWENDAPPLKRQKANSYTHLQQFASKPASFRRAASLKSDYEFATRSALANVSEELVPTEPATPVSGSSPCSERSFFAYGVPIIAPPPDHVAGLPISLETTAKIRLQRFVEREASSRRYDGLGVPDVRRQEADLVATRQRDYYQHVGMMEKDLWEELLTIGQALREDVVDWLLNVLPRERRSQSVTPGSSLDSSASISSPSNGADLFDELSNSPETRFHAVYVFLRFFYRVMSEESNIEHVTLSDGTIFLRRIGEDNGGGRQASMDEKGRKLMIWDIAVASLALSVKFHRDFLEPLSPVYSREYQDLAPHRLSFNDLENAQWDILTAISYNLGMTPQPVLDNLWLAIPALQQLLDYEGGWNCTLKETWLRLFEAISEPDALQYPLSLLTVTCLVEGILAALVHKHNYMLKWRRSIMERTSRDSPHIKKRRERAIKRIEEEVEGVIHDIQAAVGISDARLRECRSWLERIHQGKT